MGHTYRCQIWVQKGNTFCDCDDGVSAGIWVIHTGDKSGGKLPTLFDSDGDDGVECKCMDHTYR